MSLLWLKLTLLCVLMISIAAHGETSAPCASYFAEANEQSAALISYLHALADERVLSNDDLLQIALARRNPIANARSIATRIHARAIDEYLSDGRIDAAAVSEWAIDYLARQEKLANARAGTRQLTLTADAQIKFHRVEPGSAFDFTLDHPIEVMDTLVTQRMYADLMHANPSHFADADGLTFVVYEDAGVSILPDHPVESLTWFEAIKFANRLSESTHLKPAYDLANGSSPMAYPIAMPKDLPRVGVNAPDGDIYQAEGFRLPTLAEFQYLASRDRKPFRRYNGTTNDYFWDVRTGSYKPHPVATKLPMIINEHEFFDVLGNVRMWVHDIPGVRNHISPEGLNPLIMSAEDSNLGLAVGTGFFDIIRESNVQRWTLPQLTDREPDLGMRLVRTVK